MPTKVAIPTGSTPTLVVAAGANRLLTIQNQGTVPIFLGYDDTASEVTVDSGSKPGERLEPGQVWGYVTEAKYPLTGLVGAIYAVHGDASTHNLSVQRR